jgi:hypothetical protein
MGRNISGWPLEKVNDMELRVICGIIMMAIVLGVVAFFDVDNSGKAKIKIRKKI